MTAQAKGRELDQIAVVGMAGRFPRAETLAAFWKNLCDGVESISPLSAEELLAAGVPQAFLDDPNYVRAQSMLEGFDRFDARFFGFSPREAEITNPQHRLFLECSWQALEDAGVDPASGGTIGVFASASSNTYILDLFSRRDLIRNLGGLRVQIANEKEFLPTWVSYKLDLRGPSVNVQTACSSSLVVVHLACQSLLNGECDLALAGGVSVRSLERRGYFHTEGSIVSLDGHCRAFDAAAGGTVDGDGIGVVVLKRLVEARENGDNVQAVILGSAINNDGALKMGFTAPSEEGQTRVIAEALSIAGIDAESLGYVEAHGTGTRLGDPIEIAALTAALGTRTAARGFCALGSVKTNLGHLDAAAGVAGLIKTVLCLKNRQLPPSLHFRTANPEIDFAASPLVVNTALKPWEGKGGPRRAGVSSFGIGGTNAHVVLEEAPEMESGPSREWQLLVWSAKTETALDAATENLAGTLPPSLPDAAYTLLTGRRAFDHRRALVCREAGEATKALADPSSARILRWHGAAAGARPVAFLFPGQGAQRAGVTREIYRGEAVFRTAVDHCAEILQPHLGADLRDLLYPPEGSDGEQHRLEETAWAQPALFVTGYALARLWTSWGVRPQAFLGHSLGEYVAACLAGVFRLEDALALVALRGKLMQDLPQGGMLAIPLGEAEAADLLQPGLSLAAVNGPGRTVISGPWPAIEDLERRLAVRGVAGKRLRTSHAFHSAMMEPMLPAFAERLRAVPLAAPRIPYVSNLTGDWVTDQQATDPGFWLRQLREPVRFADGAGCLLRQRHWALLEVGPGHVLTSLVKQHPDLQSEHQAVASLPGSPHADSEVASLLAALGSLWVSGVEVDGPGLYRGERRRRISLPTYPFERQRFFVARPAGAGAAPWTELAAREEEVRIVNVQSDTAGHDAIVSLLKETVQDITGMAPEKLDPHATFLEIGVDSLLLIQAAQRLRERLGVQLTVVQLLEELTTLDRVATYIEREVQAERLADLTPRPPLPSPSLPPGEGAPPPEAPQRNPEVVGGGSPSPGRRGGDGRGGQGVRPSELTQLFAQQLQVVSQVVAQQLQVLQAGGLVPIQAAEPPPPPVPSPAPYPPLGPFQPIEKRPPDALLPAQKAYLDRFIRRYTKRTAKSKALTESYRPVLADGRATVAFRRLWKEIVYPIHSQRSQGSRIWDADGNDYVDINMGFGLHFFGHSPDFLVEALERQIRQGLEVGPQSPLAGQVAELIHGLTGMDRAIFCTSGTEAILGALRVARTFTGRSKIALFGGSFHGWSDTTFVRTPPGGRLGALPGAPGVSAKTLEDVVVLDYASPQAIEQLATLGGELAAVLVEPVRSRSPELQPREFLHALREVTARTGALLIFDEMITGFRLHPGGAQAWFGVDADLATYGKLVGGGLPIGVIAGRSAIMDALDGGAWRFGDDSYPQAEKTLFTGTYFKHPLTLAAAHAVLDRMRRLGPSLQEGLNARTAQLAADLNAFFQDGSVPMEVVHCGSLFRFRPRPEMQYPELFYFHLVDHGVYFTQESGNCFLTTAHSDEDVARIEQAVRRSVDDLREGGFLPAGPSVPVSESREPVPVGTATPSAPPLDLPVTDNQRILWIATLMGPDANRSYNEPLALRLRGPLDFPALLFAAQGIADRHQALRATFSADGTRQTIAPAVVVEIAIYDFSGLAEPRRIAAVDLCLKKLAGEPFDLERGPLLRVALVRRDAEDHSLSLTAHHLVIDGGSAAVMVREMSALYSAAHKSEASPLGPPGSFADYVIRVVSRAETDPDQVAAEAYWRKLFARPVALIDLPHDRPRPRHIPFHGDRRKLRLDESLMNEVRRLSTGLRTTPYATVLTVWGALLHHLTRQDDIIVGVPSRDPSVTGSMVGYFINLLPVRMQRQAGEGFSTYLARGRQALFEVQEHQSFPLNRLLDKLGLAGGLDGFLIGTTFNLERIEAQPRLAGLDAEFDWVFHDAARIDLHVNVIEEGGSGGLLEMAHRTALWDPATIDRWMLALASVLREIAADPERRLDSLTVLSPSERHQVVWEWNDTPAGRLSSLCLHELFGRQSVLRPRAAAVALAAAELSYADLDRLSTRLAGSLAAMGVGPEVRVGLCLERSFELIISLLAVLKAGGAYVPLDPGQPSDRLLFLLGDAGAPLLLTRRRVIDKLGAGLAEIGTSAIDLDEGWPDPAPVLPARTTAGAGADSLAYVLYTSGSTGKPNGVLVSHRAAVNVIREARDLYRVGPDSRVAQAAFLGFDASVLEIFLALAHGGCLCLIPEEERTNPFLLAERLAQHRVTTTFFTPSTLAVLPEPQLASVSTLSIGGEACSNDLVERWSRGRRLPNIYGPTEATVFATLEIFADYEPTSKPPAIGRLPVGNVEIYLVDPEMRPVPIGVVGEIAIGGAGLARGYLKRPEKTAQKFVPDPFAARRGERGARLYLTGDLARRRDDGRIEFRGRADGQVKLRGIRIELGEIEAVASAHPGVREAAVVVKGEGANQMLVGYLVWEDENARDLPGLRRRVEAQLPESMVPASWIEIKTLPRNANGKVDRLALRAQQEDRGDRDRHVEPRTPLEHFLADLFREVLRVDHLSIHDNFLELGGNSISGAMLAYRLQEALGEQMHAIVLFDAPTVADLAHFVAERYPETVLRIWGEESLPESVSQAILELVEELGQEEEVGVGGAEREVSEVQRGTTT